MEENIVLQVQRSLKWLQDVTTGAIGQEMESRALRGLQVLRARRGFFRCNFTVPTFASDLNGNWQVGAIATLIDNVAGAAVYSTGDRLNVTEEVEIEAKVIGNKGKLTCVIVEVRNKEKGELIAIAKQWTASSDHRSPRPKL